MEGLESKTEFPGKKRRLKSKRSDTFGFGYYLEFEYCDLVF